MLLQFYGIYISYNSSRVSPAERLSSCPGLGAARGGSSVQGLSAEGVCSSDMLEPAEKLHLRQLQHLTAKSWSCSPQAPPSRCSPGPTFHLHNHKTRGPDTVTLQDHPNPWSCSCCEGTKRTDMVLSEGSDLLYQHGTSTPPTPLRCFTRDLWHKHASRAPTWRATVRARVISRVVLDLPQRSGGSVVGRHVRSMIPPRPGRGREKEEGGRVRERERGGGGGQER